MSEKCVRCGEIEEDRRTLWMSCFYAMEELGIPFEEKPQFSVNLEDLTTAQPPVSIPLKDGKKITLHPGTFKCSGELHPMLFYTLRVCKNCRADWLEAIRQWFNTIPKQETSPNTGIFIRELGRTREISREEWDRRHSS